MTVWSSHHRSSIRRELSRALHGLEQRCNAEAAAVEIDGGLGIAAAAAIMATPAGPARDFEVARWVRRAHELGLDRVAHLFYPNMPPALAEANAAFAFALQHCDREAAA